MPMVSVHLVYTDLAYVEHGVPQEVIDQGWELIEAYLESVVGDDWRHTDNVEPDETEVASAWLVDEQGEDTTELHVVVDPKDAELAEMRVKLEQARQVIIDLCEVAVEFDGVIDSLDDGVGNDGQDWSKERAMSEKAQEAAQAFTAGLPTPPGLSAARIVADLLAEFPGLVPGPNEGDEEVSGADCVQWLAETLPSWNQA